MKTPDDDSFAKTHVGAPTPAAPASPTLPVGQEPTTIADPLIGQQLGDYVVGEPLGQGGMGLVYKGEQPMIGKRVAIKVLRPEVARDPEQVQRLLAEARAVNAIRHRGIIDIFNFGQLPDGRHYVVMEYLEGRALDELIAKKGALPPTEALEILDEVFAALGAGHEAGIIHRDLKPSNIFLVSQPDGSTYVKLLDYGLAKQSAAPRGATPQTRTDMFVGTPEYVAPEQARAEDVGPYTDIYAAGVCAFEMLTGRLPFEASSPIDWVIKHLEAKPPAPSEFVGGIPPELDALVLRMLEKDPRKRPESAEVIRRELSRIRRGIATQATQVTSLPAPPRRAEAQAPHAGPGSPAEQMRPAVPVRPNAETVTAPSLAMAVRRSRTPLYAGGAAGVVLIGAVAAYALWPSGNRMPTATVTPRPSTTSAPAATAQPQPDPIPPIAKSPPAATPASTPSPEVAREEPPAAKPVEAPVKSVEHEAPGPTRASASLKPARPSREDRDEIPSRRDLLQKVERLEKRLREQAHGEAPSDVALAFLKAYRDEANRAESDDDRRRLARKLQSFEAEFQLRR